MLGGHIQFLNWKRWWQWRQKSRPHHNEISATVQSVSDVRDVVDGTELRLTPSHRPDTAQLGVAGRRWASFARSKHTLLTAGLRTGSVVQRIAPCRYIGPYLPARATVRACLRVYVCVCVCVCGCVSVYNHPRVCVCVPLRHVAFSYPSANDEWVLHGDIVFAISWV